jgi:TolB-like protein
VSDDASRSPDVEADAHGLLETHATSLRGSAALFAGRYRIEGLLGRGGMGAVYRAVDTLVGDVVALKTLDLGGAPSDATVERFRREVRLARRITHPNVARTHDLGEAGGQHFLTMELIEGADLQSLLAREGRLDPNRALRIGLAIAEGLAAAHAAGVVHRDLKPANVLVERGGRVVLTDFGIARAELDERAAHRTAGTVGTPLFMAPEQIRGEATDARTDVYALGLVLFELLAGAPPFVGATPIATALARLERPAPDLRRLAPVDEDLAALVAACLARAPGERPADAAAVAARLRVHAIGISPTPSEPVARAYDPLAATMLSLAPPAGATPRGASAASAPTYGPAGASMTPRGGNTTTHVPRALAVLPFRFHGPPAQEYLAEALAEEVIDLMSHTRGLRVVGSGATARFKEDRDPRRVGQELAVHYVVDANVQATTRALRVAARLIDTESGTQLWSERFEGSLDDDFELQDSLSRRMAEALRVSLTAGAAGADAPAEAVEIYLRGRRALTQARYVGEGGAVTLLERALALAPHFAPALASYAMAVVRCWFVPGIDPTREWEALAKESVARALAEAPDHAETHQASALVSMQLGRLPEAARSLCRAIEFAPTYAGAHQSLGALLIEAGRTQAGLKHLRLAAQLDPSPQLALAAIARHHALENDWEAYDAAARELVAVGFAGWPFVAVRVATWRGDFETVRRIVAGEFAPSAPIIKVAMLYGQAVLGDADPRDLPAILETTAQGPMSPRFRALVAQCTCEIRAVRGELEGAETELREAVAFELVDLAWLERCPVLAPLRDRSAWREALPVVRERADRIWFATDLV